ncbi:MAG: hypothetical protein R3D98_17370 [Candidatus Krumholzibacteriia bacterium]
MAELIDLAVLVGVQRGDERVAGQHPVARVQGVRLVEPHVFHVRARLEVLGDQGMGILRPVEGDDVAGVPVGREQHLGGVEDPVRPGRAGRRRLVGDDLVDELRDAHGIAHRRPADGQLRRHVGLVAGVGGAGVGLAEPAIAVRGPGAVQPRVVEVGRDVGVTAVGIEEASDHARRHHVGVAADQQVLHAPLAVGILQEEADGLLEVGARTVVGLDPLHGHHEARQTLGGAVVGQALELASQGLSGDDEVTHGRALERRHGGGQEGIAALVQGDAVLARVARDARRVGHQPCEFGLECGALAGDLPLAGQRPRAVGSAVHDGLDGVAFEDLEHGPVGGLHHAERMQVDGRQTIAAPVVQPAELAPGGREDAVHRLQVMLGQRHVGAGD